MAVRHADWDVSKVRSKLQRDVEAYVTSVRSAKLDELKAAYEVFFVLLHTIFAFYKHLQSSQDDVTVSYFPLQNKLTEALAEPVESLLEAAGYDTWASIRKLYRRETENAIATFSTSISGFELDQGTHNTMISNLRDYARSIVEKKAREEAGKVLIHMKDR